MARHMGRRWGVPEAFFSPTPSPSRESSRKRTQQQQDTFKLHSIRHWLTEGRLVSIHFQNVVGGNPF